MIFLIVGPSGSGKDTLIDYVTKRLPIKRVKRVITRPPNEFEDFISVSDEEFDKLDFLVKWSAHGKKYGIPFLGDGDFIINVSRSVVGLFPNARVIELVADKDVLARRLLSRKRDSVTEVRGRLSRHISVNSDIIIDTSSSDVSIAGEKLVSYLKQELLKSK